MPPATSARRSLRIAAAQNGIPAAGAKAGGLHALRPLLEFLRSEQDRRSSSTAAGYTGKPNVDACELDKAGTLAGNTLLPQTIAHACAAAGIPWGHISSGCIYSGAKIAADGAMRVEKDMTKPELHALAEEKSPAILGFTETDTPNFSFRDLPCSFYSGTKALGEEAIAGTRPELRLAAADSVRRV